jgi:hypothetical protein
MPTPNVSMKSLLDLNLGQPIGQLRAQDVKLGNGAPPAILAVYCADFDVDPYTEMFFFPTDTLKFAFFTADGEVLWRRDLGKAVVPGMWFCPFHAMDLDGDGADEIYFVNNLDPNHPLAHSSYRLERIDARTGKTSGQWQWPHDSTHQALSHAFRNFIFGGQVRGAPVLVTAQGTYEDMYLQGWNADMSSRWRIAIPKDAPGARGSHQRNVADIDGDGSDEVMWGERCIRLDDGKELFCCDRESYNGHSDVVQPVFDVASKKFFIYTCRESDDRGSPRVALYDNAGRRVWGAVDKGHIDMGWVARLGENRAYVSMAIRIGNKTCGPDGRYHTNMEEFTFETLSGRPVKLPYSIYRTLPADVNGDGYDELVSGLTNGTGEIIDRHGATLGNIGGPIALSKQFMDRPGEQLLAYYKDGHVRIWVDEHAGKA